MSRAIHTAWYTHYYHTTSAAQQADLVILAKHDGGCVAQSAHLETCFYRCLEFLQIIFSNLVLEAVLV